ncbi:hypothetical protein ES703_53610 [subsurface metagenome]
MRSFDWDNPILGKLTATDFAEAIVGVVSAVIALTLLILLG